MKTLLTTAFAVCLSAATLSAGEKGVMHCFAYTPMKEATPEQMQAFNKATDALPSKVTGLKRVWRGKLARPMKVPTGDPREYGVCMEFADQAAFKAYDAAPGHKEWVAVYEKVRVPGTTSYQIIAE